MNFASVIWAIKAFIVLAAAIWTGMFTRYVGQLLIDWSKKPNEWAREVKNKKARLSFLLNAVENSAAYCRQMESDLSGLSGNGDSIEDKLRDAAFKAGKMVVIPTFNLDLAALDVYGPESFTVLGADKANMFMVTKRELLHVSRRIDTIAEMVFLRSGDPSLNALQRAYIAGTRELIKTTIDHCTKTQKMLDDELKAIKEPAKRNWRPLVVVLAILACIAAFVWASISLGKLDIKIDTHEHGGT